jgi:hypothetical protein
VSAVSDIEESETQQLVNANKRITASGESGANVSGGSNIAANTMTNNDHQQEGQ